MRVTGLGYEPEYFELDDHDVVHVAITYVDPLVRAFAPVWLPHIAPTPLCGLGARSASRRPVPRNTGPLCRRCEQHVADLNEWVRLAETRLAAGARDDPVGAGVGPTPVGNRVHRLPF